jgi:uncharacterized protein (DUF1501 family)
MNFCNTEAFMNRRNFLEMTAKSLSFMAINQLLSAEKVFAGSSMQQYFMQITISGGWDVTLGIDPWLQSKPADSDMFIEYDPSSIYRDGSIALGPAMMAMQPYTQNMAVINGIFLSEADNGHQAAEKYILTGSVNPNWGSLIVEYGECRGEGFLGIVGSGLTLPGTRSPRVTPGSSLTSLTQTTADSGFSSSSSGSSRLDQVSAGLNDQATSIQAMKALLALFTSQGASLNEKHHIAAAMAAGLAKAGTYSAQTGQGGGLDTHANHAGTHLAGQSVAWQDVADLLKIFKATPLNNSGESLFDRTTFFITSEFSRTAALNASGGKDHNPICNSALIISPNVRSSTVGGSRLVTKAQSKSNGSYHIASAIDFKTGQALQNREGAFIIRPENVAATVIELLGISRRRFASVPANMQSLTHLVRR